MALTAGLVGALAFRAVNECLGRRTGEPGVFVADREAGLIVALDAELMPVWQRALPGPRHLVALRGELVVSCAVDGWAGGRHILCWLAADGRVRTVLEVPPLTHLESLADGRLAFITRPDGEGRAELRVLGSTGRAEVWCRAVGFSALHAPEGGHGLLVGDGFGRVQHLMGGRAIADVFLAGGIREITSSDGELTVLCGKGPTWLYHLDATDLHVLGRARTAERASSTARVGGNRLVLHARGVDALEGGELRSRTVSETLDRQQRFARVAHSKSSRAGRLVFAPGAIWRIGPTGRSLVAQGGFDLLVDALEFR